jgi:hypothetical protein
MAPPAPPVKCRAVASREAFSPEEMDSPIKASRLDEEALDQEDLADREVVDKARVVGEIPQFFILNSSFFILHFGRRKK